MTHPQFVDEFDDASLEDSKARYLAHSRAGLPFDLPEHEARAVLEKYLMTLLDAKVALASRGVAQGSFPAMFNELLIRFDAMRLAVVAKHTATAKVT